MEALYERVLARVPTPQLHENYNGVLQEELEFVSQTLDDAGAAFAKLEEVREAVSKLQQSPGSSTSAHSDSLIALADNTTELQQKLRNQLNKLAVGQQEKKRKRVRELAAVASISTVDAGLKCRGDEKTRAGARCNSTVKKAKRLEADVDSYSDSGSSEKEEEAKLGTQKPSSKERGDSLAVAQKVAEASGLMSTSSSGSESDEREEDGSDEDADNVEGSEAAWKALKGRLPSEGKSKLDHAVNTTEQREEGASTTVKPLNKSATYMKTIVEEAEKIYPLKRLYIVPDLLAGLKEALKEDVDGLQQSAVASSLEVLVGWWTDSMHFQVQHAGLYREYVAVVESYLEKLPSSAQKFELKRQQEDLLSKINTADNVVSTAKKEKRAANAIKYGKKHMGMLSKIAGSLETSTTHEKHINRLLHMLLAFKLETAGDVDGAFSGRMIKAIVRLSRRLSCDLQEPIRVLLHRMIVNAMRAFSGRIPNLSTKNRVTGLLDDMSAVMSNPSKNREQLTELRNRATQVFGEVENWQGKSISPGEAVKLRKAVKTLMEDTTVGWNPYQDITMRKCIKELKGILLHGQASGGMKSWRSFELSLSVVLRWKVEDPPVAIAGKAPTK